MNNSKYIELIYLRTFLCLLIILTHVLTEFTITNEFDVYQMQILYRIRMILIIGIPAFIILSQLLTTLNYNEMLRKGYLRTRFKFILIPYIIMGSFIVIMKAIK